MAKKGYGWVFVEPKPKTSSDLQKLALETPFQSLIDEFNAKLVVQPNPDFGYVTGFHGKWYRHYFYVCQTMRYDNPDYGVREAEYKTGRIECFADDTFAVAYFRHTGQWHEITRGLNIEDCLEMLKSHPIFHG